LKNRTNSPSPLYASFGSNCEVALLIERRYGSVRSHLFNWANISLQNLCLILERPECLAQVNQNIKLLYRCLDGAVVRTFDTFEYAADYLEKNIQCLTVNIDYRFECFDRLLFWSHGIGGISSSEFASASRARLDEWTSSVHSKHRLLQEHTCSLLTRRDIPIVLFIKALKDEYTDDLFVRAHSLIVNGRTNVFLGIIYEGVEDCRVTNELAGTRSIRVKQLTPHDGAIYTEKYQTVGSYDMLFDQVDSLLDERRS
jgi:hypothetical protein